MFGLRGLRLILLGVAIVFFCFGVFTDYGEKTRAEKARIITVYSSLANDHGLLLAQEFEKRYGIKVVIITMPDSDILARLLAEKPNPQADVWLGGLVQAITRAKKEGLLQTYVSPEARQIAGKFKDPDGVWTGILVDPIVFVANKDYLQKKGVEPPCSWEQLTVPELKGRILMGDPGASETAYTVLSTVVQLMGEENAFRYLKRLHQNIQQYPPFPAAPARLASLGEVDVGIVSIHDAIRYIKGGFPLVLSVPEEGTGYQIGTVAMVNGAPHQEDARKFMDWLLTKEAQDLGTRAAAYQLPVHPEAGALLERFTLDKLPLIDYNQAWAQQNHTRLVEKWIQTVRIAR